MNRNLIAITDEAVKLLEQAKTDGYSLERLASEAIIAAYGNRAAHIGPQARQYYNGLRQPLPLAGPIAPADVDAPPTAEEWQQAVSLLDKHGSYEYAIASLKGSPSSYRGIANALYQIHKAGGRNELQGNAGVGHKRP